MKYEKLNNIDHYNIDKLPKFRGNLIHRRKEIVDNAIRKGRRHLWVQIAVPILVAGVGIAAIYLMPGKMPSASRADNEQVKTATTSQPPISSQGVGSPAASKVQPLTRHKTASRMPSRVDASPSKKAGDVRPSGDERQTLGTSNADTTARASGQDADLTGMKLVSAVACNGVQDRQPLGEQHDFSVQDQGRAYVWMEIRSRTQPFTVKHIYYLNGQKYTEVSLEIKHPRMRTWSYVTLNNPSLIGAWRVDIVSKGSVLKTIDFEVGSGSS